jgi:hypothetical protein
MVGVQSSGSSVGVAGTLGVAADFATGAGLTDVLTAGRTERRRSPGNVASSSSSSGQPESGGIAAAAGEDETLWPTSAEAIAVAVAAIPLLGGTL